MSLTLSRPLATKPAATHQEAVAVAAAPSAEGTGGQLHVCVKQTDVAVARSLARTWWCAPRALSTSVPGRRRLARAAHALHETSDCTRVAADSSLNTADTFHYNYKWFYHLAACFSNGCWPFPSVRAEYYLGGGQLGAIQGLLCAVAAQRAAPFRSGFCLCRAGCRVYCDLNLVFSPANSLPLEIPGLGCC